MVSRLLASFEAGLVPFVVVLASGASPGAQGKLWPHLQPFADCASSEPVTSLRLARPHLDASRHDGGFLHRLSLTK